MKNLRITDIFKIFGYFRKPMETLETKSSQKVAKKFYCEICDYVTSKKSNFDKHTLSAKHDRLKNGNQFPKMETNTLMLCKEYKCLSCVASYASKSGLWKHAAKCSQKSSQKDNTQIFIDIVKKNEDVKQFLMDQNKQLVEQNNKLMELLQSGKTNTVTNNVSNTNNTNNNFNLNVYLNDTCKDAININEFIDSLVLSVNDLEETARIGYAEGISKIFINGLQNLDACKRPLHCSDIKRNTLYIKNENQWIKETEEKPILTKAIKQVAHKNIQNIFEWQKHNPHYNDPDSKQNDKYNQIICQTMSGSKEEQMKNCEKIVKNISKEVVIEKP